MASSWSRSWSSNWWIDLLCPWRFFRKDPKRDVVLFLGPKFGGKTELYTAINNEPFKERTNTGLRVDPHRFDGIAGVEEKDYGMLRFTLIESGGEDENMINIADKTVDHLIRVRPDRVLVVLVFDVNPPEDKKESMSAQHLAEYICLLAQTCEGKWAENKYRGQELRDVKEFVCERYKNGGWYFTVVGTHGAMMPQVKLGMESLCRFIEKYRGKMTPLFGAGDIESFELSASGQRENARLWMARVLREMER